MPVPNNLVIKQLDVELNGGCNFKCKMCPQEFGREKPFLKKLPFGVFEKILDDALQYGVECVSLHGSGEPTLNRNMPDYVRMVKERGLKCISFTNGYKLTDKLSGQLIDAGIDILRVSAIGYDRESYHKWMSMDAFEEVRRQVKIFVDIASDEQSNSTIQLYHLITDVEKTQDEIQLYRANWADYTGALSEIWLMHNWSGGIDPPYNRSELVHSREQRSCGRPFSPLLQVRAGGLDGHHAAVVACCMVLGKDTEAVLGHLDTQSISEVVSGEKYEELRKAHLEKRFDDISYCKGCDQLYDLQESLVWTNIPGRAYGQSKIVSSLDHREYTSSVMSG